VSVCYGYGGGWGQGGKWGGGGRWGGERVTVEGQNGWMPSEVNRFRKGFGRCSSLYVDKVTKCFQEHKLDLQLASNVLQDIQNSHVLNTGGCPGCRGTLPVPGPRGPGPHRVHDTKRSSQEESFVFRTGTLGDAIEITHLIQEESVLLATDEDLNQACHCFSTAFDQTMKECQLSHIMCKTPQTCRPDLSCPLLEPAGCSPKSSSLIPPQTPVSYSCDIDYCTEGTGTCRHSWLASVQNYPTVSAVCDDSSSDDSGKNQESFNLKAICQIFRPGKRSTTYAAVLTALSTSPSGLSAGAIAGIVVGAIVAILLVVALVVFVFKKPFNAEYQ
jgi:hypothetical protein